MSPYSGIDRCDSCGRPLEAVQGFAGLCQSCAEVITAKGTRTSASERLIAREKNREGRWE